MHTITPGYTKNLTDPEEGLCEEPVQQQTQTQDGPGECDEGPCGEPVQQQTKGTMP